MKFSEFEKQGFQGVDINLETSLCEYGIIWKEFKYNLKNRGVKKGEYIFYIGNEISISEYGENYYSNYDHAYIRSDIDLKKEFDWIEWHKIFSFTGMNENEFFNQEFPFQISDLISYYGTENIFGISQYINEKFAPEIPF